MTNKVNDLSRLTSTKPFDNKNTTTWKAGTKQSMDPPLFLSPVRLSPPLLLNVSIVQFAARVSRPILLSGVENP